MKKKAYIIVGLGFGDEGKGMTTDFICRNTKDAIVIRYNGGHQAGHTVTLPDGNQHVFATFGSGTFSNVPTYWSNHCVFSPSYLNFEIRELPGFPVLFLDRQCYITTHYDILYNRLREASRGKYFLGSCGRGIGATIDRVREETDSFLVNDMLSKKKYIKKIKEIKKYYQIKIEKYTNFSFNNFDHDSEDKVFLNYIDTINDYIESNRIKVVSESEIFLNSRWKNYIFEGAQGVLLDQVFGNFPYITKSNTTSQNAISMLKRNIGNDIKINIYYVTRSYLTRHGRGNFVRINKDQLYLNQWETNKNNEYQGQFKVGLLNMDLLNYAINCDLKFSKDIAKNLMITCVDQLPDLKLRYIKGNRDYTCLYSKFAQRIDCNFNKIYFSANPCPDLLNFLND